MSFAERYGPKVEPEPRVIRDEAPGAVRRLLLDLLEGIDDYDVGDAYDVLKSYFNEVPKDTWGQERRDWVVLTVDRMDWTAVYDLIEKVARPYDHEEKVNAVFAEAGIAFEYYGGEIHPYQPEADELEVADAEFAVEAAPDPHGAFKPAIEQMKKANVALAKRPPDLESAVAQAVNALEGTVKVITGENNLSAGLKKLYSGNRTTLAKSMEQLFNYGSAVPGARHGAHAASNLNEHEARYAVRNAASAMAYLMRAHDEALL